MNVKINYPSKIFVYKAIKAMINDNLSVRFVQQNKYKSGICCETYIHSNVCCL